MENGELLDAASSVLLFPGWPGGAFVLCLGRGFGDDVVWKGERVSLSWYVCLFSRRFPTKSYREFNLKKDLEENEKTSITRMNKILEFFKLWACQKEL